ncbi:hypothetical protein GW17_00008987 [Ensete ventricosum]|nr:hypothetical protein GW17_00008987 [Ensete ventricosum]
MLRLITTKLLRGATVHVRDPTITSVCLLLLPLPRNQHPRSTTTVAATTETRSRTLCFLQDSCGLSPEAAGAAAKTITLKTTENPIAVLALLRNYGFSNPQIADILSRWPRFLLASPDKTLKPKLDFFRAELGLSDAVLLNVLTAHPWVLMGSLENKISPNLAFLRSIIGDETKLSTVIRRWIPLIVSDLPGRLLPAMEALRSYGATDAVISKILLCRPKVFDHSLSNLGCTLNRVKAMGICPSKNVFVHALSVLSDVPQPLWDRKLATFQSLGWSEEQVLRAFARLPNCMAYSDEKVRKAMEFFTEKLSWTPDYVCQNPSVLSLSLEKRILLRCRVLALLESKGLFKGKTRAGHLIISKHKFLKKYVINHQDELPEILDVLKGGTDT